MVLFLLASIAGLFPGLLLPIAVGWKALHAFDLLFAACVGSAAIKRAFRPIDLRLVAAGGALIAAGGVALWANPSPPGAAAASSVAYSVVVLLTVAHIRIDALDVRADRTILWPLLLAAGIAWVVLLVETAGGVEMGQNISPMLPRGFHRLGGFTGGNTLILFMCLGAPLIRAPWAILLGVLPTAFAALSRAVLGVGVGLILAHRNQGSMASSFRRAILAVSWAAVGLAVFFYAFAVIPVGGPRRSLDRVSFELGGYLTPHVAALRMLRSSPALGVGPARFAAEFPRFTSEEERLRLPRKTRYDCDPHSAILGVAAEQGLLGLSAFAWLIYEIVRRLNRIGDSQLRSAAMAGLIGLLVGGHFVDWLSLKGLWFWIGLLVASRGPDTR